MFELMQPKLQSYRDAQRAAAVACVSAMLRLHPGRRLLVYRCGLIFNLTDTHGVADAHLFACLVDTLVRCLADTTLIVRLFAVRGLGDVCHASDELFDKCVRARVCNTLTCADIRLWHCRL
jgi:hypothetical protein